jgi:anti-sigma factor RsiW
VNCRKVNSLLSAYIDAELPGVEQLQIRDHLKSCRECSDEYESLLTTKRMLSALRLKEPASSLEQRILDRLASEERQPAPRSLFDGILGWWEMITYPEKLRLTGLFAAASVLLAFGTITPRALHHGGDPLAGNPALIAGVAPVGTPAADIQAAQLPAGPGVRMPVNVLVNYHNPLENVPMTRSGFGIEPVSLDGTTSRFVPGR